MGGNQCELHGQAGLVKEMQCVQALKGEKEWEERGKGGSTPGGNRNGVRGDESGAYGLSRQMRGRVPRVTWSQLPGGRRGAVWA